MGRDWRTSLAVGSTIQHASSATRAACLRIGVGSAGTILEDDASSANALTERTVQMADIDHKPRTSGRCSSTGSFIAIRASKTCRICDEGRTSLIRCLASSSQALTSVLGASSPCPKSAVTAVSGRGSGCGSGRESTDRARASRVNPCDLTSGTASFRRAGLLDD